MAVPAQKFRELVFQLLYSTDLGASDASDMIPLMMKELSVTRRTVREAQERCAAVLSLRSDLDARIASTASSYSFERIQLVERSILRLGVYEILFDDDIPPKVAISESVRLARKFSTPEAGTFINAVLDGIWKVEQGLVAEDTAIVEAVEQLEESEERVSDVVDGEAVKGEDSDDGESDTEPAF